ncbi:phytoene/squalene synthase family protein [Paenibacillus sp. TRM 82003]|nr:phytoene/squalene synthase family protein [Paenibacillus sp. TRM 82003]
MISADYRYCESVVRKHSSSFYRAFGILPEDQRNAVWAVYAFCRTVDDLVDDHTPCVAAELLEAFETSFDRFLAGRIDDEPMWRALADTFRRYPMDASPFKDMIEGQRQDLSKTTYATLQELDRYCYLVAGTVGLMLLPILTPVSSGEMREKAVRLGKAMQITNILRDVAEDFQRGRLYLPEDRMAAHGFDVRDIPRRSATSGWLSLYHELFELAEGHYKAGLSAGSGYPRSSRLAVTAAGLIYREILTESKRRRGDVFAERIRISNKKKMSIVLSLLTQRDTWKKHLEIGV